MINRQGSPRLLLVNNLSQEMEKSLTCTCSTIKPGQAQIKSTLFPVSFEDMTFKYFIFRKFRYQSGPAYVLPSGRVLDPPSQP